MSLLERNTKYLISKQVIWRQNPWSDIPTKNYEWGWYYENGTHQCYSLFASKAKINTFKSLNLKLCFMVLKPSIKSK